MCVLQKVDKYSKTFMVARNIPENVGVTLLNIFKLNFNVQMYNHGNGVVGTNVSTTVLSTAENVECR